MTSPVVFTTIDGLGSASLLQGGSNYYLDPNGGMPVELSYGGSPVVAGQFADQAGDLWAPIAAAQTASGYEVAWKLTGADEYTVWYTDSSGDYISSAFTGVSGTSSVLESFETSFEQDLNDDGVIGSPAASSSSTVIETTASISPQGSGSIYFLTPDGGTPVELSYGGAPVVVGQFTDQSGNLWAPIAAEQTANGYEVAWKLTGADEYSVWYTAANGNFLSSAFTGASGTSGVVESFETNFQQDLNGDGVIGPPAASSATVIAASASTSLLQEGNNYFLEPNGGTAVELSYGGSPVVAGQFTDPVGKSWAPIGVQQTASGYEVAWKLIGADEYTVWYTDSSGNYLSSAFTGASGTSSVLESFETSFQQDLNGDGVIGPPAAPSGTVIAASASTSLLLEGNNYFLEPNGGTAVELSYGGSPVVAGQFADSAGKPWAPIAAEQTASGYEVAWKVTGADEYTVWYTDSSGNYLSSAFIVASGSSSVLESFEASFQQDLNGDGVIGPPTASSATVIEATASTSLLQGGNNYFLEPNGGTAVELSYQGAPVVAGQFTDSAGKPWAPIAAEQTASGYEVAWKVTGADEYTVWYTDSSGNYLSSAFILASGTSSVVESFETSFQHDLNGDGVIGPPAASSATVIEASASTSLLQGGNNYFLEPNGGTAVELSYQGAPVVAGQFTDSAGMPWAPIAAEQTASGYEVAWKVTGADEYTVWYTDSSGNYLSSAFILASGTSSVVESFETSFQHDLNGDGVIGPPAASSTVIEATASTSLLQEGNNYFLEPNGGTAVELSYGGSPVVAGQFADSAGMTWAPIAAEQTASGYEVAWKVTGADEYTIWNTDSSGNYLSSVFTVASGSSSVVESFETSFQHDLNGDGVIGPPTVIEAFGSTSLLQGGNHYFLDPNGGTGVELSYGGAPAAAGQFADQSGRLWAPIGVEQTASGFEVAWKATGADEYTIWNTDVHGSYVSTALNSVSGTSAALESIETSFNQDLNGDGVVGSLQPQFVYEGLDAQGARLYDVTWANSGLQPIAVRVLEPENPSTNYAHNFLFALPVEAGLAQSNYGSGLDELQKLDVQDQYNATIIEPIFPIDSWYANSGTDASINYETFMSTILATWVDSNFATTGDEKNLLLGFSKSGYGALDLLLKHPAVFDAAAAFDFPGDMTAYDEFGSSSSGDYGTDQNFQNNYHIDQAFLDAWKAPFTTLDRILISEGPAFASQVADIDSLLTSNGVEHTLLTTQTSDTHAWYGGWLAADVAGLYGLATDLHQTVIETSGSTSLVQDGNNYFLEPQGGTAVELSNAGSPVVAGQLADQSGNPWAPIAVEQTASGFEVAWKATGADEYMVWNTDAHGNYVSTALSSTSGMSAALESFEFNFNHDLNGDGYIGPVLNGSSGGQTLTAGSSPTTLIGGPNDVLTAGSSADTFVFKPNFGANTVNNFTSGVDTLQFSHLIFADAATALSNAHQVGSDVAITYDSQDVVTLHNLQLANLHATDFHIV